MSIINKSVIILAGGKSTRLGGFPKSHLLYNNETFIDNILREVLDYEERVISSNSPFLFKGCGVEVIEDEIKDIGPMGGIYTCLKRCKYDEALIIGVDMPLLQREYLNHLGRVNIKGNILIPVSYGKIEPLCGIYNKIILKTLEESINDGDYSLTSLIKREKTVYIDYISGKNFTNINTFRDYEGLEEKSNE